MITEKIAPEAPSDAFDLLWQFIELAPSVYERVDDSKGDVGDVFRAALAQFEEVAPNAGLNPKVLAGKVWDALSDNGYGEFDGIISLLSPTLGHEGLEHLKTLVLGHKDTPVEGGEDHAALQFLRDLRSSNGNFAADQKSLLIKICLQDIATAQGDTDAYIAQYSAIDLERPRVAAEVARILIGNAQPEEALSYLSGAQQGRGAVADTEWDAAYITCLLALGREDDAQNHRWVCFNETLDPQTLRDYLKVLPDFDLDGNLYHILAPAAETLRDRHPLAAALLWRAMINHALWEGRSTRYGHAVDHLMDCAAADNEIEDYGAFQSHDKYVDLLREAHKHKSSFWARLP